MVPTTVAQHFYVYQHRRGSEEGPVFYVGKGSGSRAWTAYGRHPEWHAVASADGFVAQVIARELTEQEALQLEQAYIEQLGIESLVNRALRPIPIDPSLKKEWSHLFRRQQRKPKGWQEINMSISVQARAGRFQLRVKHRLLQKPFFFTFNAEEEARAYGKQLRDLLERGIVPIELVEKPADPKESPTVIEVIRAYTKDASHVTSSDADLLGAMYGEVAGLRVSGITYAWADRYVRDLKVKRRLAPGSIRKRVGALARVLDWHLKQPDASAGSNPLRSLPVGYSQYSDADQEAGAEPREDIRRDRRLMPGELDKIRPHLGDLSLLFEVVLDAGLRLREAYRLRVDQVDLAKGVLHVDGSKVHRGRKKPRTVPLVPALRESLKAHCDGRVGLLWPYWDGTPESLKKTTARLSQRFTAAFTAAGVADLTEHDIRHEACCRWVEMRRPDGAWMFSEVEICKIMGWSSLAMMLRYASLRGEDLAARLVVQ